MPWSNQVQNQVIIAGTIPGLLTYSPSVGFGNLIASISATATTDPSGNAVLAGEVGYTHVGGTYYAVQSGATGTAGVTAYYTATSAAGPWTLRAQIQADATGFDLTSQAGLTLVTGGSAGSVFEQLSSGLSGGIPVTNLDRTPLSVGNSAAATDITNTWTINAGDGSNGAKYTIETLITITTGATTAETFTLGLDLNSGTLVSLATLGASFNGSALSTTYDIPVRLTVVPGAGTSGADAQIALSAVVGDTSANRLATNSAVMSGHSNGTAFNAAVSNTIALYAQWGGAGGTGQSAGTNWSEFTRSGQN